MPALGGNAIGGKKRTTWFLWKEMVSPSEIHRRLSEICAQTAPAHTIVFNLVHSLNSGKETASGGCPSVTVRYGEEVL
jgi:hypothetical protein